MASLGVIGGSFDPVHRGHLFIALLAREAAGLDEVLFVPARRPPHKPDRAMAPPNDRLAMLKLALRDEPASRLSSIELEPDGPRYTVDTLSRLRETHPGTDLSFILGFDSLRELVHWREPDRILDEFRVIAVDRPGVDPSVIPDRVRRRCLLVEGNPFAVSSTVVRARVARGLSIRHLVPDAVAAYIERRGLYRAGSAEG